LSAGPFELLLLLYIIGFEMTIGAAQLSMAFEGAATAANSRSIGWFMCHASGEQLAGFGIRVGGGGTHQSKT
jgi:hypothetical protein